MPDNLCCSYSPLEIYYLSQQGGLRHCKGSSTTDETHFFHFVSCLSLIRCGRCCTVHRGIEWRTSFMKNHWCYTKNACIYISKEKVISFAMLYSYPPKICTAKNLRTSFLRRAHVNQAILSLPTEKTPKITFSAVWGRTLTTIFFLPPRSSLYPKYWLAPGHRRTHTYKRRSVISQEKSRPKYVA